MLTWQNTLQQNFETTKLRKKNSQNKLAGFFDFDTKYDVGITASVHATAKLEANNFKFQYFNYFLDHTPWRSHSNLQKLDLLWK